MLTPDPALAGRFVTARPPPGAVLHVGLVGAHCDGFPSADGDLDPRGVHLAPTEALLGLEPPPDTHDALEVFEKRLCEVASVASFRGAGRVAPLNRGSPGTTADGGKMAGEFHEPRERLSEKSLDVKRAIDSMMEELEAVDWYRQRMQACADPQLRAILDHHQREEVEHFAMLLEWCRRNDADFAEQLRTYLFSEGDILNAEEEATAEGLDAPAPEERAPTRTTIGAIEED
ncbi:MAG TPA: nucleotidyltransferase domain-containing protein [Sandaracinaceae bacterium LLY-WYZ-13_1]|nr:nucleotidyltransferase domain-containing protein [Sandaracinaceae bacterium LLY-WYZ-13_1]